MYNYPGPPPPPWFGILFVVIAVSGCLYFLFTDFWVGILTLFFLSMGFWGDIARQLRKVVRKFNKPNIADDQ
jgi:hypothetical protein